MKEFALNGSLRTETGKKASKQLRKDDTVPAVLYGGEKNILFSVAEKDLKKLIYTPDVFIVNLTINKKPYKAIIKEMQFHPVTDRIIHLDFLQVFEDKNLTIALPI
ncbi:MAG: 50S ribosomal protein L25, partial [Bacteroidales bacterium]|nr:50S ribosomal protein L25 [Bacteroidales bacterium]